MARQILGKVVPEKGVDYYTESEKQELITEIKSELPTIPSKISELTNDSGYITSIPGEYITEAELSSAISEKADSSAIPTKTSQLTNDSGFITGFSETDPTVPSYIKEITQEQIDKWNSIEQTSSSYNDLKDKPITNLSGTDETPIYLRDLQTKAYILNGVCKPYNGSDDSMNANNAVTFVNHFETVTAIQIFYPPYNQVQYFEVYDNDYTSNVVGLNNLVTKDYVDSAISTAINSIINGDEVSY